MSIAHFGAAGANQTLSATLGHLQTDAASHSGHAFARFFDFNPPAAANATVSANNLSDAIMRVLVRMQELTLASASASQSTTVSASTMATPLQALFSSIDASGDGTISKGEMETYIQGLGGTQNEADALYNGLTQNGTDNLTEKQLANDLAPPSLPSAQSLLLRMLSTLAEATPGAFSGNGTGSGPATSDFQPNLSDGIIRLLARMQEFTSSSATQSRSASASTSTLINPLNELFSAIDTSGSGTISKSEMEAYIEGLGGTQTEADALFNGLTENGTVNLSETQLASDLNPHGVRFHHIVAGSASANGAVPGQGGLNSLVLHMLRSLAQATPSSTSASTGS